MADRLLNVWEFLRTSLWFVPLLMVGAGVGLVVLTLRLDASLAIESAGDRWWLYGGDLEDARDLLSTLLSSMITMTALVVSITVVVLAQAASQLGPRLIRSVTADPRTQLVIGFFVMTIVYCLLLLRSLDHVGGPTPHVAVTTATALVLASVLLLLFLVHNLARSIVSDTLIERVGTELDQTILSLPPAEAGDAGGGRAPGSLLPEDFARRSVPLALDLEGYVQAIEYREVLALACRHDVLIRLDFRAGHFLIRGGSRATVYPGERAGPDLARGIAAAVLVGPDRTPTQDLEFSIRHLVEIAQRALSPSLNDPFTAIAAIDRIAASLARLESRRLPPPCYRDGEGNLRVVCEATTRTGIIDAAFNQIRQAAGGRPDVVIHLLDLIARLAVGARTAELRGALRRHARMIAESGRRHADDPNDAGDVERRYHAVRAALDRIRPAPPSG